MLIFADLRGPQVQATEASSSGDIAYCSAMGVCGRGWEGRCGTDDHGWASNAGCVVRHLLTCGRDSIDDMTAGYKAGAATVLLVNDVNAHLAEHEHTDLIVSRLDELIEILEAGFVGRIGREESSDTGARAEGVLREGKAEHDARS